MKCTWISVLILLCLEAVHCQRPLVDRCPEAEDIKPCTCGESLLQENQITCRNVNNEDTLRKAFQNAEGFDYYIMTIDNSTLEHIPREIVEQTEAKFLQLKNTILDQIFDSPPQGADSIVSVTLQNIRVSSDISWSFFEGFSDLTYLHVRETNLDTLGPSFSQYLSKKLFSVDFRNSEIKEIKSGALSQFPELYGVSFVNCSITILTRDIFPRPWRGTRLELNDNKITSLPEDMFTDMPRIYKLNLERNFISELSESAFQRSTVQNLDFTGNPLKCDCRMLWLLNRELVQNFLIGECAFPKLLEGKPLRDLTTSDFHC